MTAAGRVAGGAGARLGQAADSDAQGGGFAESGAWARLAAAQSQADFAHAWLELQCRLIGDVDAATLVLGPPGTDNFAPVAYWPPGCAGSAELAAAAELALAQRRGVVRRAPGEARVHALAFPLIVAEAPRGVVAVAAVCANESRISMVMRLLQWGLAWWQVRLSAPGVELQGDPTRVLGLVATALEGTSLEEAATAAATELAVALGCERVAFGVRAGRHTRVRALSHSAAFNKTSVLIRDLAAAMDEAVDRQETVCVPPPAGAPPSLERAHATLAERHGSRAVCTVPLSNAGQMTGALTLERAVRAFSPAEVALCEHAGVLLGPILELKRRDQRWIGLKLADSAAGLGVRLLGRGHPGLKAATLAAAGLAVFLGLASGDYRVVAAANLEGTVQRALVAPLDGYVSSARVRAGDLVAAGELLAALEDKDLKLQKAKWDAEREKLAREYAQALAKRERAQVRILAAQIEQAQAQGALIGEQLARIALVAPFDGVVVSGDLSQSIGAPVARGDVLFELAPLDSYRVVLEVDERDIAELAVGQAGRVALSGLPSQPLPLRVAKITPVARAQEGRNLFRVEATLGETLPVLRPGMQGVAKVEIGRRKLFWIWTHRFGQWLRLAWWSWSA